jgi:hypothetical protein
MCDKFEKESTREIKISHAEQDSQSCIRTKKINDTTRTTSFQFEDRMDVCW